jgi:uncharacterized membrane protein YeaQ/YmgE (transglycosylase-associated protein family)
VTVGVYLILIALSGLVVGPLAQRFLRGDRPMGMIETIPIGIAAALLAGLIGWYAVHSGVVGFLLAVLATVGLVNVLGNCRTGASEEWRDKHLPL